jgi:hypothetical protein
MIFQCAKIYAMDEGIILNQINAKLSAILVLLLAGQTDDGLNVKPEVFLARAGLKTKEIAQLLGKNEAAVSKAVQRARS